LKNNAALLPLLQLSELENSGRDLPDLALSPEAAASVAEMRQMLSNAVAQLSPEYRIVYELRDLEEIAGDTVAARLGISRAAMKSRLHRARALVRQNLEMALAGFAPKTI